MKILNGRKRRIEQDTHQEVEDNENQGVLLCSCMSILLKNFLYKIYFYRYYVNFYSGILVILVLIKIQESKSVVLHSFSDLLNFKLF